MVSTREPQDRPEQWPSAGKGQPAANAGAGWGASSAPTGDVRIAVPEDVAHDPEVLAVLSGRIIATLGFRILAASVVCFCVALPVLLLALAAWTSNDTSRRLQVVWAIALVAIGAATIGPLWRVRTVVTSEGLERISAFSTVRIPWERINWFEDKVGEQNGLWVMQFGGAAVRIPTVWHYSRAAAATAAAARANALFGMTPRRPSDGSGTDGVPGTTAPRAAFPPPDPAIVYDPAVQRLLSGGPLRAPGFWWFVLALSPFVVVLPTILLVLGVTSDPLQDTSYRAQIGWAVFLYICLALCVLPFAFVGAKTDEQGITTRTLWKTRRMSWREVQGFLPGGALGVNALTTAGRRHAVPARRRWAKNAASDAYFLNEKLGRGAPLAYCIRCHLQFDDVGVTAPDGCSFHPVLPVRLGEVGEGDELPSRWLYPCCKKVVLAARGSDDDELVAPVTPGCVKGPHLAPRF